MKVRTITYSRLKSLGNYENEKIEVTVEVAEDETPIEVLNEAKAFVKKQFGESLDAETYIKPKRKIMMNNPMTFPKLKCYNCKTPNDSNQNDCINCGTILIPF